MLRNLFFVLSIITSTIACQQEEWLPAINNAGNEVPEHTSSMPNDYVFRNHIQRMPYLAECDEHENRSERRVCSDLKILQFIAENIKFPQHLGCYAGSIVASFMINEDGSVSDVKIRRGLHPALDAEVLRVVRLLPPFRPGIIFDRVEAVEFNLPIKLHLE